jgi:hypothetical protein
MSNPSLEDIPNWKVLKLLKSHNCKIIEENLDVSLKSYIKGQIASKIADLEFVLNNRKLIASKLQEEVELIYSGEGVYAYNQFMQFPGLQTSDHSSTLYDSTTFVNNFLYQIALRENNLTYMFTKQCNIVKGLMNPKLLIGPAFIDLESDIYKIFNLSKCFLKQSNIAAMQDVTMTFEPQGIKSPIYCNHELPEFLDKFKSQRFAEASDAFKALNLHIWTQLNMKSKKQFVPLDENFVSDILIKYLQANNPVINALLFDKETRLAYIQEKAKILESDKNILLNDSSDFFHYRRESSLKPIKFDLKQNRFYEQESGLAVNLGLTKEELIDNLKNRTIYADLVFSYIFLELLPDVDALGGTSQQEYLPLVKEILLNVDKRSQILPVEFANKLEIQNNSKLIGPCVLELSPYEKKVILTLNRHTNLDEFENTFINKSLKESVGQLNAFNYFNNYIK